MRLQTSPALSPALIYEKTHNKIMKRIFLTLLTIFSLLTFKESAADLSAVLNGADSKNIKLIKQSSYLCKKRKTIDVSFYENTAVRALGSFNDFTPNKAVTLVLSEGLRLNLPLIKNGDEFQYANPKEDIIFATHENRAYLSENNKKVYDACVLLASDNNGDLPQSYNNSEFASGAFSIRYPSNYSIDTNYKHEKNRESRRNREYEKNKEKRDFVGVKFHISSPENTNLLTETGVSIEQIHDFDRCTTELFMEANDIDKIKDNGITYLTDFAKDFDILGRRYEEKIWVIYKSDPCTAIRYFTYYTSMSRFDSGDKIHEFDRALLNKTFDEIRRSLVLNQ